MEQFRQTYLEESFEGLEIMESGLLELTPGAADSESINTIFRAAHSIKGGGATFGFTDVTEFTHVIETLLDQMRSEQRDVTEHIVDLLLSSVDCLHEIFDDLNSDKELNRERINDLQQQLKAALDGESSEPAAAGNIVEAASAADSSEAGGWKISFLPHSGMLQRGNEPLRIFRELAELGELEIAISRDSIPTLSKSSASDCYLGWDLTLDGEVEESDILEVFEWVELDCDLTITPIQSSVAVNSPTVTPDSSTTSPAAAPKVVARKESGAKGKKQSVKQTSSIRVSIDKVDNLVDQIGELVITQSMLSEVGENFGIEMIDRMREGLVQLERNTRELQESVMQVRMLPISFSFNRFPRVVHDLSSALGKKIELVIQGEGTELDKTVLEKIGDPLTHLVRNSIDHGVELPADRVAAGKSETGIVSLNAYHQGGSIVIEVSDDGAGIDHNKIWEKALERGVVEEGEDLSEEDIYDLLFHPGFSTAEKVTDVSGRGVGMDVVRRNVRSLGGNVEISSKLGEGSVFTVRLPLTLAILDGQLLKVGSEVFIIPLVSIIESTQIDMEKVKSIAHQEELYKLRDEYLPIVRLHESLDISDAEHNMDSALLVVVEASGKRAALMVDDLLGQQQVVIKSLETNFIKMLALSGATILGDGTVSLILDVAELIQGKVGGSSKAKSSMKLNNRASSSAGAEVSA